MSDRFDPTPTPIPAPAPVPASVCDSPARGALFHWLIPFAAVLVLWGGGSLLPERSIVLTIGDEAGLNDYNEARHMYSYLGWGGPEVAGGYRGRRGEPVARFAVPWAFRMGEPLRVTFVMSGWGVQEPVRLRLNDTTVVLDAQESGWRTYTMLVSRSPAVYGHDLYMEWQTADTQGPLLHQVVLHPHTPPGMLAGQFWPIIGVIVVFALAHRQPTRTLLPWVVVLVFSALAGRLLYEPQCLPWGGLAALGSGAAALLTVLVPNGRHRLVLWGMMVWMLATPQIVGSWILDDAFISFRYARNLIDGAGLTYNPGGELVEGYTNFLWTVIVAGGMALGFEPVVLTHTLCTALALVTLLLCYRIAAAWWPGRVWALVPPLLLALNPAFLLYTARSSGMETALVTCLTLAALWLSWRVHDTRTAGVAGVACALAMLARPDGVLVTGAAGVALLLPHQSQRCSWRCVAGVTGFLWKTWERGHLARPGAGETPAFPGYGQRFLPNVLSFGSRYCWFHHRSTKNLLHPCVAAFVVGVALLYAPYFLWRWSYYGYLLPNTFYAKVGATLPQLVRGARYVTDIAVEQGGVLLVLALLASGAGLVRFHVRPAVASATGAEPARVKRVQEGVRVLWLFVLLTTLYVIAVGGDQFPHGRFFIPMLPPLALLTTHGAATLWGAAAAHARNAHDTARGMGVVPVVLRGAAALLLVLLVANSLRVFPTTSSRTAETAVWAQNKVTMKNIDLGLWLRDNTPADTVVATGIAGALPYYAERHTIDMLGLNDLHIAHMDVATMGQGIAGTEKSDPAYVLDRQPDYIPWNTAGLLAHDERLRRDYERVKVLGPRGGMLTFYRRQGGY